MKTTLLLLLAVSCTPPAQQPPARQSSIERSNQNAQVLLDVGARFQPELASRTGVAGIDDRVFDFQPGHLQRQTTAYRVALAELRLRQASEQDPLVAQDLTILVDAAEKQIRGIELRQKL